MKSFALFQSKVTFNNKMINRIIRVNLIALQEILSQPQLSFDQEYELASKFSIGFH